MKKTTMLVGCLVGAIVLVHLAIESQAQTAPASNIKRYQINSAVVEFALAGAQNGTETLYFTDYGVREAKYTTSEIKLAGITQKTNKVTILEREMIYSIDLDKRTGTKMKNPMYEKFVGKDATEVGEKMMKSMGAQKTGTEVILDKTCDVWEVKNLGSKTWIWNGIPLKTETKMMGMQMAITATQIEAEANIPKEKFEIPAGVKMTEALQGPKMLDAMKKRPQ